MIKVMWKSKSDGSKITASECWKLIDGIETYIPPPSPPYFFPYKWMLKDAIKFYEDTEIIIVDTETGNMWQRGKKLKERLGDKK